MRSVSPEHTWTVLEPLLETLGITRLANVTGLDRVGIPVYMACRPLSRGLAVSQGKGLTPEAARVSAAMEALESWVAERLTLPLRKASYRELGDQAVDPQRLPRYKKSAWTPDEPLLWVQASNARLWVPYELVHTDYRWPLPEGSGFFLRSSNGLASGNTPQEAANHAVWEVIERDAMTLWALTGADGRRSTRLDLRQCPRELIDRIEGAGLRVAAWDMQAEIPALYAAICEPEAYLSHLDCWGAGCHPDPEVALTRALTEAAQTRLTLISGSRDDMFRGRYQAAPEARRAWLDEPEGTRSLPRGVSGQEWPEALIVELGSPSPHLSVVRAILPDYESAVLDPRHAVLGLRAQASRVWI